MNDFAKIAITVNDISKEGNLPQLLQNSHFLFAEIRFCLQERASNFVSVNQIHSTIRCAAPVCIMLNLHYLSPLLAIKTGTE